MNCRIAQSIIQDYLERRLVILDRNEFVRHVSECTPCQTELAVYREVFTFLGGIKPAEPPRGFQNAVISQLKAEGLVYRPKVPAVRRWIGAFLDLPGLAKYPLAAGVVVAALYFPLILILRQAEGFAAEATVFLTNVFLFVRDALGDVSFLERAFDALGRYATAGRGLFGACLALVSSAGENLWVLGIGVVAVLMAILTISHFIKKRSSHHAPFSF
jgi:hypothetical protein